MPLDIHVPKPHPKQAEFIYSPAKRKVIRAGRRGGKTVGVSALALWLFARGHRVLYAAPTMEQVGRFWTTVVRGLREPLKKKCFGKMRQSGLLNFRVQNNV